MDRLQQRHEALTGRRGVGRRGGTMARRQGRFHLAVGGGGGGGGDECCYGAPAVAVVDQADCTAQSCRSCVAVTLADCIALGCCPCAVVSLLGLAFVKVPLAVARRCVRRRQGRLRQKKRVRDLDPSGAAKRAASGGGHGEPLAGAGGAMAKGEDGDVVTAASPCHDVVASDVEEGWLELYQVGHWGFGRLSVSSNHPPVRPTYLPTGRNADCATGGHGS